MAPNWRVGTFRARDLPAWASGVAAAACSAAAAVGICAGAAALSPIDNPAATARAHSSASTLRAVAALPTVTAGSAATPGAQSSAAPFTGSASSGIGRTATGVTVGSGTAADLAGPSGAAGPRAGTVAATTTLAGVSAGQNSAVVGVGSFGVTRGPGPAGASATTGSLGGRLLLSVAHLQDAQAAAQSSSSASKLVPGPSTVTGPSTSGSLSGGVVSGSVVSGSVVSGSVVSGSVVSGADSGTGGSGSGSSGTGSTTDNLGSGPDGPWIVLPESNGTDPLGNPLPPLPGVAAGPAPAGDVLALGPTGSEYAFDMTTHIWIPTPTNVGYEPGVGYVAVAPGSASTVPTGGSGTSSGGGATGSLGSGPDGPWIVLPKSNGTDPFGNPLPDLPGVAAGPAPSGDVLALGPPGTPYAFDMTTHIWIPTPSIVSYEPGVGYVAP